jgi:aspartate-semialdehyde dehydrogenase
MKVKTHFIFMKTYTIAVVGATGLVGRELLNLLECSSIPIKSIKCFASEKSKGKKIKFKNEDIAIDYAKEGSFKGVDMALFCTESDISKELVDIAVKEGAICIDSSSHFRLDNKVPLIIPEINGHILKEKQYDIIASPNCTTTIMLMALYPLHNALIIDSIIASTYQAASGGGKALEDLLMQETIKSVSDTNFVPSYAFNIYLHDSKLHDNNYCSEELKMLYESRKIMHEGGIKISATCVRVPVMRAHSMSLNVTFKKEPDIDKVIDILKRGKGIVYEEKDFPTPQKASGRNEVLIGRVRKPLFQPFGLEMWVVGDQLLKGAALNVLQIAELICQS